MPKDRLWVLDFDRCLGDIDALYGRLQELIESRGILPPGKLGQLRQQIETSGGSFDALGETKALLSQELYEELLHTYVHDLTNDEYLLSGAREFLSWLHVKKRPFMIMTYGQEEWQLAKLRRAGLSDLAHMVTPVSAKGGLITGWRQDGYFAIPRDKIANSNLLPERVEEIVLVDDKAKAFADVPTGLRGYWIQSGALLPSQQGEVPDSVRTVSSFQEIMQRESDIA